MIARFSPQHLPVGTLMDGWKVLCPLGEGGFGAVQKVEKEGRLYALKVALRPEGSADEKQTHARTLRELLCLLLLEHPNIVRVRGHGWWFEEAGGHLYLVLEYVEGWTLAEWVERMHPTAEEIIRVFLKLAGALVHMHERGVYHRDLKLTNVLIRKADGEPVIIDFGAADFTQAPELTGAGLPPGTERYRSPEANAFWEEHRKNPQARYEFRVADELFAFGVMLHDVLTDPRPTQQRPRTDLNSPLWTQPDPQERNPRIPAALASLVKRLLALNPALRPENVEMVRRELEELAAQTGPEYRVPVHLPSAQVEEPPRKGSRPLVAEAPARRRRPHTAAVAGGVGLVALATLAVWGWQRVQEPASPPPPQPLAQAAVPGPAPSPAPPVLEVSPPAAATPTSTASTPAPQKEGPAMKLARNTSPLCAKEKPVPTFPTQARFLQWCRSAGVLGTTLAFCAGCPGAQLRPDWPADCPKEVLDEAQRNGLIPHDDVYFNVEMPADVPVGTLSPPIRTGRIKATVSANHRVNFPCDTPGRPCDARLPPGTILYGEAWVTPGFPDPDYVVMRFDRVRTPDKREFRVCLLAGEGYPGVWAKSRTEDGAARFARSLDSTMVERFPGWGKSL